VLLRFPGGIARFGFEFLLPLGSYANWRWTQGPSAWISVVGKGILEKIGVGGAETGFSFKG
jgi:hypothetical protein